VVRIAHGYALVTFLLVCLFAWSPAMAQGDDCGLPDSASHLARLIHESDFGHPYYRQAPSSPERDLPAGSGFWLSFEAADKPPLTVLLDPTVGQECKLQTESFCVTHFVATIPDEENLIEPLIANVFDLLRRKDHGGFDALPPSCKWVYLGAKDAPEAALSTAELDRTAHWRGFYLWVLLTVVGGAFFLANERRRRFRRDGEPVRWLSLAGVALLLWLLAVLLWQTGAFALLWLGLWALVIALAMDSKKIRQLWFPLGLVGIVALFFRVQAPHLPANWYVALQVPGGAPLANVIGEGGFAGLFRSLGAVLPISSAWVFGWNVAASTLTAMLFTWAGYRSLHPDGERRWPSWLPAAWGMLVALDPIIVRIGASDATHVTALFAAAVSAACYVEATRSNKLRWWLGALFAAVLIGWTRLEFAAFPLVLPFLFGMGKGTRSLRWGWVMGFIGMVAVAALASMAKRTIHAEVTQIGTFQWSFEHVTSWFKILTLQFLRDHNLNQALYLLFVPFVAWAIWSKRAARLGPVVAFYLLVAPRVVSPFHEPEIAWNLLIARYDLAIITVMYLWAAAGLFGLWTVSLETCFLLCRRASIREGLAPQAAMVITLIVALTIFPWGRPTSNIAHERYPFQFEYRFLDAQLDSVEEGTVIVVWQQGDRHEKHDFDTGLAIPHPLLVMDHPDIRWVVVNEFNALPEDVTDGFFFPSANSQLDPQVLLKFGAPEAADSTAKLSQIASKILGPGKAPLATETHRPTILKYPLAEGELRLEWYGWKRF
jgi:hypothetical protein